jgi:hypothetical protein
MICGSWLDHVCSRSSMQKNECARVKLETYAFVISNSTNQPPPRTLILWHDCTLRALHTDGPSAA